MLLPPVQSKPCDINKKDEDASLKETFNNNAESTIQELFSFLFFFFFFFFDCPADSCLAHLSSLYKREPHVQSYKEAK